MRGILLASTVLAAITAGGAARAADMPMKAPPAAPLPVAYNWTGFYIGVHGGIGWADNDRVVPTDTTFIGTSFLPGTDLGTINSVGLLGGGQVGFNWQFGQWLLGIEGDIAGADITGSTANLGNDPAVSARHTESHDKIDMVATLAGRVGFVMNNLLLYAKGGGAWVDFSNHSLTISNIT